MHINFKRFRLSIYREHLITGFPPIWKFSYVQYTSADTGGTQNNYSLSIGLLTFHFKWRNRLRKYYGLV